MLTTRKQINYNQQALFGNVVNQNLSKSKSQSGMSSDAPVQTAQAPKNMQRIQEIEGRQQAGFQMNFGNTFQKLRDDATQIYNKEFIGANKYQNITNGMNQQKNGTSHYEKDYYLKGMVPIDHKVQMDAKISKENMRMAYTEGFNKGAQSANKAQFKAADKIDQIEFQVSESVKNSMIENFQDQEFKSAMIPSDDPIEGMKLQLQKLQDLCFQSIKGDVQNVQKEVEKYTDQSHKSANPNPIDDLKNKFDTLVDLKKRQEDIPDKQYAYAYGLQDNDVENIKSAHPAPTVKEQQMKFQNFTHAPAREHNIEIPD